MYGVFCGLYGEARWLFRPIIGFLFLSLSSFLLAFGGVGELSVNKHGCVVGKRVVCYHVLYT